MLLIPFLGVYTNFSLDNVLYSLARLQRTTPAHLIPLFYVDIVRKLS
jgi:hypothetical protein